MLVIVASVTERAIALVLAVNTESANFLVNEFTI